MDEPAAAGDDDVDNLYGTSNQRLLRRTASGVTLYVGGMELTASGGSVIGQRFYTVAGQMIGWRDPAGLRYAVVDHLGSVRATVVETTGVSAYAQFVPYGERSVAAPAGTDRGFLGERHDPSGLVYLNNRTYDPATGMFVSVDPLVLSTRHPYLYGAGNPVTMSDRSGLAPCSMRSCPDGIPVVHYGRPDHRSWNWPILRKTKSYGAAKELHDAMRIDGPAGRWVRPVGQPIRHDYGEPFDVFRLVFDYKCGGWSCGLEGAGLLPLGKFAKVFRALNDLDLASDTLKLTNRAPHTTSWLRGTVGNAGRVPDSVRAALEGKTFSSRADFRSAFWRAAGDDPALASQFSSSNVSLMQSGRAPLAPSSQHVRGRTRYELHHVTSVSRGGAEFDLDNIVVVTPRYHQEVLSTAYHYGGGG